MTTILTDLSYASNTIQYKDEDDMLKMSVDPVKQLLIIIPMVHPQLRKTLAFIINHPHVIELYFTPNDRITLLYLYTSVNMAMIHPSKQTFEERVKSFQEEPTWVLTSHLSPESMALWGFFRKSPIDKQHTCCFACGCVLSDWVMDDNPFLGHSQFRPQCQWTQLISLFERIFQNMQIQNSSIPVSAFPVKASSLSSNNYEMPVNVIESRLKQVCNLHQAAHLPIESLAEIGGQSVSICRDIFGYSIHDIFFALCRKMFRYFNSQKVKATIEREANIEIRHLYATAQSLVTDIMQHMDWNGPLHQMFPFQGGIPFVECVMGQLEYSVAIHWSSRTISKMPASEPSTSMSVLSPAEPVLLALEVKKISASSKKALINRICVKCVRRPAVYLCVPCKHLAICKNCNATAITACPACHVDVTDILRVFL